MRASQHGDDRREGHLLLVLGAIGDLLHALDDGAQDDPVIDPRARHSQRRDQKRKWVW